MFFRVTFLFSIFLCLPACNNDNSHLGPEDIVPGSVGSDSIASPLMTPIHFETQPITFRELLEFAHMANASYSDDKKDHQAAMGKEVIVLNQGDLAAKNLQVLVGSGSQKNGQYVAIRGTANTKNAVTDAKFVKHTSRRLQILLHQGFRGAAEIVAAAVQEKLDKTQPVYITGHSLGGAVAVIVDAYLRSAGFNVKGVVTFGQPRVTDAFGASVLQLDAFDFRILRVVHHRDPITVVPKVDYVHFAPEIVLADNGSYCVWSGRRVESAFGKAADHKMDNYIERLKVLQVKHEEKADDKQNVVMRTFDQVFGGEHAVGISWGCSQLVENY